MASTVPECSGKKPKSCKWRGCALEANEFESIEQVLEHVLREHIPKVWKNEDGEEEVICEWDVCEMGTSHGDLERKTEWMKNHFKTRHAKSAKTFKCVFEDCQVIRSTSQELESHVRTVHLVAKRKTESKEATPLLPPSTSCSSEAPPPNRIWKVLDDGRVVYDPPMKVTKKTIIYYDDGPRYVFPTGYNQDSDESELGEDEHWECINYHDSEETRRKAWRPPRQYIVGIRPPFVKLPPWYDPHNPPVTDSEEEERRRRPKRVKRKNVMRTAKKANRLHEIVKNVQAMSEEKEKLEEESKAWKGSFWQQYIEKRDAVRKEKAMEQEKEDNIEARDFSEPPALIDESEKTPEKVKVDEEQMPILTAEEKIEDVNNNDASFPDSETEHHDYEDVDTPVDEAQKPESPKKTPKTTPTKKLIAKSPKKSDGLKMKKRPSRSCRNNYSFYEIDEDIEVFEEILESPQKKLEVSTDTVKRGRGRPRKIVITPEVVEIEKTPEKLQESLKSPKSLKGLESPNSLKSTKTPKSPKRPKSPTTLKRPSRACRVLGSMEEVPFDLEINVEFDNVKIIKTPTTEPSPKRPKIS